MVTRLGLYGGARQLYGDFSGKTPFVRPTPTPIPTESNIAHLRLIAPRRERALLESNLTPTQATQTLLNGLVLLDPIQSTGSPEGSVAAKSRRFYADEDTKALYYKFLDSIDRDPTFGWKLITPGSLANVSVNTDYKVLFGNKNISATGNITITFVDAEEAGGQEITIKNSGVGIVNLTADVDIEGSNTLTSSQSLSWFYDGVKWEAK